MEIRTIAILHLLLQLQYWILGIMTIQMPAAALENLSTGPLDELGYNSLTEKKVVVSQEFHTLEENINTVKKLKLMVDMFGRIKRDSPSTYKKMVDFFERNENAHRLRRSFLQELMSIGKKKKQIVALEQKLDTAAKCHPKSGKELIQMFVKGLSELYPDMTKTLLAELQDALGDQPKKTTTPKVASKKVTPHAKATTAKVSETSTNKAELKTTSCTSKHGTCTTKHGTCTAPSCHPTVCCQTACATAQVPPACKMTPPCAYNCVPKSAEVEKPQKPPEQVEEVDQCSAEVNSHTGSTDPIAAPCAKHIRTPTKRRAENIEELTSAAPNEDVHVYGSTESHNSAKSVSINKDETNNAEIFKNPGINWAKISSNWMEWLPNGDRLIQDPLLTGDLQELNEDSILGQSVRSDDLQRQKSRNEEDKIVGSDTALMSRPFNKMPQDAVQADKFPLNPSPEHFLFPEAGRRMKRARNKKRSMYVLYEK